MRILITGITGFIGTALAKRLVPKKELTIFGLKHSDVIKTGSYQPIIADLSTEDWTNALPNDVEVVIHLAQSNRYREFPDGAKDMFAVNLKATFELLEWCRNIKVKRFIYASTGNVYKPSEKILTESDDCYPSSMYAVTKLNAEYLIRQYKDFFTVVICRIFTVFGHGQKNMLIPNIIDRVKTNKIITLAQGAGIYLSPIHVDDVCLVLEKIIRQPDLENPYIINLTGDKTVSLAEIVVAIGNYLNIKPNIINTDEKINYLCASSNKLSCFLEKKKDILNPNNYI